MEKILYKRTAHFVLKQDATTLRIVRADVPEDEFEIRAFWVSYSDVSDLPLTPYQKQIACAKAIKVSPVLAPKGAWVYVSYREDKLELLEAYLGAAGVSVPAGIEPIDEGARGGTTRTFGVSFHSYLPIDTPKTFFGDEQPYLDKGMYIVGTTQFALDMLAGGAELRYKVAANGQA